ncbi:hypothetical protein OEZ60_11120 [Defluviimonas sp. WL0024]|uniref:WD40-like Beta Propeller Repeat n=2 Tax=Albidovulum TaxID=205889 RepID=A0ABT3IYE2_9RHOB|nr:MULTISPECIES: hypothetical protein [Defluviimonas]MCU9848562.1 hypothetical protein [Defluviimonas sp. WL0024]MCW3780454.1 hypothetical protein [Defluviimonas salinarum]
MTQDPVVRLHLYFARDNDRAVILRQGPSKQFRLILWHRDTDTFEDGQWLKHKVYPERCDLSPDGRHFLYFALNGDWSGVSEGAYSALSRPPYFTALALFPEGSTWGGGGRFLDNVHYVAVGGADVIGRDDGLVRLYQRTPDKDCPTGLRTVDGRPAKIGKAKAERAFLRELPPDPALSLYDTLGGRLHRRRGNDLELIRDFTEMTFEPIRAPYDWREPHAEGTAEPWHPLGREEG